MWSLSITKLMNISLLIVLFFSSINFVWAQPLEDKRDESSSILLNDATSMLSQYLAIPSETGNENKAGLYLKNQCSERGLFIETLSDNTGCINFAASLYPLNLHKPNIIFLNHIDVVKAYDSTEWVYQPYKGIIADNKIWGRGSIDNKGQAIIQLFAIEKFIKQAAEQSLPYNITLLSVSGEETGGFTGSAIVSQGFKEHFSPVVVIGEGGSGIEDVKLLPAGKTFFGISVAEKGSVWIKLSCTVNTYGHSAVSGNDYAIKRLVKGLYKLSKKKQPIQLSTPSRQMFKQIGQYTGGVKGFVIKHIGSPVFRPILKHQIHRNPELESVFCNKITISNLKENHSATNQILQETVAILDCRYLPNSHPDEILAAVKKSIRDPNIQVNIERQGTVQYYTTPEYFYNELEKAIVQVFPNSQVVPILLPAGNDNSYFRKSGCPVYGLYPMIVSSKQLLSIHNSNEYLDLEDIDNGIKVFESFLQSVQYASPTFIAGETTNPQ